MARALFKEDIPRSLLYYHEPIVLPFLGERHLGFFHRRGLLFDFVIMWSPPQPSQSFSYLVFAPRGCLWDAALLHHIVLPILFFLYRWPPLYVIYLECQKYILLFLQNDKSHILLPVKHLYLQLPCLKWMSSSSTVSKFQILSLSACVCICAVDCPQHNRIEIRVLILSHLTSLCSPWLSMDVLGPLLFVHFLYSLPEIQEMNYNVSIYYHSLLYRFMLSNLMSF